jgi:hypothetical protein
MFFVSFYLSMKVAPFFVRRSLPLPELLH